MKKIQLVNVQYNRIGKWWSQAYLIDQVKKGYSLWICEPIGNRIFILIRRLSPMCYFYCRWFKDSQSKIIGRTLYKRMNGKGKIIEKFT